MAAKVVIEPGDEVVVERVTKTVTRVRSPELKPAVGTTRTLFRLVLGTISLGREALAQSKARAITSLASGGQPPTEEATADLVRYAAIGAAARAAGVAQAGFSRAGKVADGAFRLAARALGPITGNRLMAPARRRFQRYEARGEEILRDWIALGRSEEILSRAMAQQTGTGVIEEVLDYLAVSPEMDELVAQQSQDMAGEVVEEIRERTTRIFIFRDWFATAILRRRTRPESDTYTRIDQ